MFSAEKIPVVGSMFGSDEERQAQEQTKATAERYRQLKPELAQTYNNALRQQLSAYGPANDFLGGMVGDEYKLDLGPNGLGAQVATPGLINTPGPRKPDAFQHATNFISGFDPAMGEGLNNVYDFGRGF